MARPSRATKTFPSPRHRKHHRRMHNWQRLLADPTKAGERITCRHYFYQTMAPTWPYQLEWFYFHMYIPFNEEANLTLLAAWSIDTFCFVPVFALSSDYFKVCVCRIRNLLRKHDAQNGPSSDNNWHMGTTSTFRLPRINQFQILQNFR